MDQKTPIYQPRPFKRDEAVGFGLPSMQEVTDFLTKPVNPGPKFPQFEPKVEPAATTPATSQATGAAKAINPDIAGAFANKYGSKAEGLRPVVAKTTNGGLEDFVKATKGMNLDQIATLVGMKPAPTKPRGYKDVVADALAGIAAQDYAAVVGDDTTTTEQKLQARAKYALDLQKIMGLEPLAEILSQLGQQSE